MQLGETALASNFFNVAILALSGQELYFPTLTLNDAVQIRRQKTRFRRCFPARAPPSDILYYKIPPHPHSSKCYNKELVLVQDISQLGTYILWYC